VSRRREQTRLRVRRHRAKRVTHPTPGAGSVTWRRGMPPAAVPMRRLGHPRSVSSKVVKNY
jgi:hypothetical protein